MLTRGMAGLPRASSRAVAAVVVALLACLLLGASVQQRGPDCTHGRAALVLHDKPTACPAAERPRASPRILLRYMACMGGFNQMYCHVNALTLAAVLDADVVLPPALARDSYDRRTDPKGNETMKWTAAPAESMLDVVQLAKAWRCLGIDVQSMSAARERSARMGEPPQLDVLPKDLREGFLTYTQPKFHPQQVVRLKGVNRRPKDITTLVDMAHAAVRKAIAAAAAAGLPPLDTVVLDLPCTLFSLNTTRVWGLTSKVALSLRFNPDLQALADRAVDALTDGGRRPFNGLHLRMETDAKVFFGSKGEQGAWDAYVEVMRGLKFNSSLPVYVATGLLTYNNTEQWDHTSGQLQALGLAGEVFQKGDLIKEADQRGLHMEQVAVLDFLVLARAHRVVGLAASTFSTYLREYRALHGIPKETIHLVGDPPPWFRHTVRVTEDLEEMQPGLARMRQWAVALQMGLALG